MSDEADSREVSAAPQGDTLPPELDVTAYVGPQLFPDNSRRRLAGVCLAVLAVVAGAGWLASGNDGLLVSAVMLLLFAGYHFLAGVPLAVDETDALLVATRTVGFAVGHSSAQLGWRGLRSRPSWRILVYSADEPPSVRGLVEIDGVDGTVLGQYTEENPEDWSAYGLYDGNGVVDSSGSSRDE